MAMISTITNIIYFLKIKTDLSQSVIINIIDIINILLLQENDNIDIIIRLLICIGSLINNNNKMIFSSVGINSNSIKDLKNKWYYYNYYYYYQHNIL